MRSKTIIILFIVLCVANAANAEVKIESVSQTVGVMGKNMDVTLTGTGFTENTKVSMYIDSGNQKAIIGSVDTPDHAKDIKVVDGKAYVVWGDYLNMKGGLQIIDVSDPKNPKSIGSVDTGSAYGVAVSGDKAFVADRDSGLQIIDVSNSKNPKIISAVDSPGVACDVAISGNNAFVVWNNYESNKSGLQIIDISDPQKPETIGAVNTLYNDACGSVAISGDKAFLANGVLQIIDISDPKKPEIISTMDILSSAISVAISGDKAFVVANSDWKGLQIIDISDPKKPEIIDAISTPCDTLDVTVNEGNIYVTDTCDGLMIINDQTYIGAVYTDSVAMGVAVNGDNAYVLTDYAGLQVVNVREPNYLTIIGYFDTPDQVSSIVVDKDKAYIASMSDIIQIIDISDLAFPKLISSLETPGQAIRIALDADKAYIASMGGGFQIVDVSNPAFPNIIGSIDTNKETGMFTRSVAVSKNNAYVAIGDWGEGGLLSIDVSNPAFPTIIGNVETLHATSVAVSGDKAYLADWWGGFYVIDVSNPAFPKVVGTVNVTGYSGNITVFHESHPHSYPKYNPIDTNSIAVYKDKVYMVYLGDLKVIDVSNPSSPNIIAALEFNDHIISVAVYGDKVLVGQGGSVTVIDMNDPTFPNIIGSIVTEGYANSFAVYGDEVLVGTTSGLNIMPMPVKISDVTFKNDNQLSFIVHGADTVGDYILRVYNLGSQDYYEHRNAITFVKLKDDNVLHAKAIIVAGDKKDNKVREEIKTYSDLAYKALRYQGYTVDNVRYLSNLDSEFSDQVDRNTSKQNLRNLITSWAANDPKTSDLLIYFVGHGTEGEFIMADNEKVAATELNNWLNELKRTLPPIRITFIYDACRSGSFVSKLNRKDRIVITSSDSNQSTYFTGNNAFSYHFWSTLAGETVRQVNLYDAFKFASEQTKVYQTALADAKGDGIGGNDLLKTITVGRASFNVDMTSPSLISQKSNQILHGESSATLQIEVAKADVNLRMWATIIPPDYIPDPDNPVSYCSDTNRDNCISRIELSKDSDNNRKYTVNYDQFNDYGTYTIVFQAEIISDSKTSIFSLPQYRAVTQMKDEKRRKAVRKQPSADAMLYEENDSFRQATYIDVNSTEPQHHTFYKPKDEDWLKFIAASDKPYNIKVRSMNPLCDVLVELYGADGTILPESQQPKDMKNPSGDKILTWTRPDDKAGVYYVRLRNADENIFGETIKYDVEIYQPTGDFHGYLEGKAPAGAVIKTDEGASDIADSGGNFTIVQKGGDSTVTLWVPGYKAESNVPINIIAGDTAEQNLNSLKLTECQSPTARIVSPSSTKIISKGESVNFQGDASGGNAPYEYFWYFGGAPNSDKQNPGDVVFDRLINPDGVNIFYPVLYVKDADGCVGKSQPIAIRVNKPIYVDDSLALNIPCAEYQGVRYGFTLNYSKVADDPSGHYWKMDISTFKNADNTGGSCISVGDNLNLSISSAIYHETAFAFTLNYNTPIISDPFGFYWKMDLSTFKSR